MDFFVAWDTWVIMTFPLGGVNFCSIFKAKCWKDIFDRHTVFIMKIYFDYASGPNVPFYSNFTETNSLTFPLESWHLSFTNWQTILFFPVLILTSFLHIYFILPISGPFGGSTMTHLCAPPITGISFHFLWLPSNNSGMICKFQNRFAGIPFFIMFVLKYFLFL